MIERTENGKSIFTIGTRIGYNDAALWEAVLRMNDPFQDAVPCWQAHTQRDLDCGLYGFSNRYY